MMALALACIGGYLAGSVPFALLSGGTERQIGARA